MFKIIEVRVFGKIELMVNVKLVGKVLLGNGLLWFFVFFNLILLVVVVYGGYWFINECIVI